MDIFREDENFEIIYVCPYAPIVETLEKRNLKYHALKSLKKREIDSIVKEFKPDIIHAHDFMASVIAAKFEGIEIISHIHNNSISSTKIVFKFIFISLTKEYNLLESISIISIISIPTSTIGILNRSSNFSLTMNHVSIILAMILIIQSGKISKKYFLSIVFLQ